MEQAYYYLTLISSTNPTLLDSVKHPRLLLKKKFKYVIVEYFRKKKTVKFPFDLCFPWTFIVMFHLAFGDTWFFRAGTGVSGSLLLFRHFWLRLNFPHPQAGGTDRDSTASPCVFTPDTLVTSLIPQQPRRGQMQGVGGGSAFRKV